MLIKIQAKPNIRSEIIEITEIFKARIVDISDISLTLEVTGDPGKIVTIQELLKRYTILEIARTGKISLERELGINSEFLKNL